MISDFKISGMSCSACSAHIERAVSDIVGVKLAEVNLLTNSMRVDHDSDTVSQAAIIAAVERAGYGAEEMSGKSAPVGESVYESEGQSIKRRFLWSLLLLIPLFLLAGHLFKLPLLEGRANELAQFVLALAVAILNRGYFIRGFRTLSHGAPNMDTLVAVGAGAGIVYSILEIATGGSRLYFESSAMILTLITLGKYLEARSKGRTGDAIRKLLDLAPKQAIVERSGREMGLPVELVVPGDTVVIRSGAQVPVDGVAIEGAATLDESMLTGESMPVDKRHGDRLTGGSVCLSGFIKMRAEKVGDDTTLAQMAKLVEEAGGSRAPISQLADRVSRVFVPLVMLISLASFIVWAAVGGDFGFAVSCAIAVLVVSCPCALGLATPVAIMVGTGRGAELGILFRSAAALEELQAVDTVVLDKTGTITQGRPAIANIMPHNSTESELLCLAAAIEGGSSHPIAKAIIAGALARGIEPPSVSGFFEIPGRGISGTVDGKQVSGGNREFMRESGVDTRPLEAATESWAAAGETALYFAADGELLGAISVADPIKSGSHNAIKGLKAMGMNVVMLTGDNRSTACAIGLKLDIAEVVAEVLPAEKAQAVAHRSAYESVAMVGDGVNDAPALARADVGIAIGGGADIAIEAADVVLMKSDLNDVAAAVSLSRAVIRNIRMNLFWAFFYNTLGIPLAAGVFYPLFGWTLHPVFGAAAMSLSSFCVVSNALRLRWFQPPTAAEDAKEESVTLTMSVEGMTCGHCKARVEKVLMAIPGVESAQADLATDSCCVVCRSGIDSSLLVAALKNAGYDAAVK